MSIKNKPFFLIALMLIVFFNLSVSYADAQIPTQGPCTKVIPASAPNLYQITAGNGSATLYFAPPSAGFDGFTISYGLDSSASNYNATLSQGPTTGAVTYTINSLTPNTQYYFKVRANNGCAPGPWSNVLSSTVKSTTSSSTNSTSGSKPPVTGPSDVLYFGIAAVLLSLGGAGIFLKYK